MDTQSDDWPMMLDGPENEAAYGDDVLPGETVRDYRERKARERSETEAEAGGPGTDAKPSSRGSRRQGSRHGDPANDGD